jgi:hypothetical protein
MTVKEMTPMREKLNSRDTPRMLELQSHIDMMPAGAERDHHQGIHDRMCDKLDNFPGRVADQLHMCNDREKIRAVLERECEHIVSELPGSKFAGN